MTSNVINSLSQESETPYYYYHGEKVYLSPSQTKVVVTFKKKDSLSTQSLSAVSSFLSDTPDETLGNVNAAIYTLKQSNIQTQALSPLTVINTLKSNQNIESVHPVYTVNDSEAYVTDTLIYMPIPGKNGQIQDLLSSFNATLQETITLKDKQLYVLHISSPYSALQVSNYLYESGLTIFSHPNFTTPVDIIDPISENTLDSNSESSYPNDPSFSDQWFLNSSSDKDIDAPEAWELTEGDNSVVVAVIDVGYDLNHPELKGKIVNPYNAVEDNNNPDQENQNLNHGTPCAGLIGALTNNSIGVSSVGKKVRVMPILGFGKNSSGNYYINNIILSRIAKKVINTAGVVAVSNSWSLPIPVEAQEVYFQSMRQDARDGLGAVILAASGNRYSNQKRYPASYDGVVSVGASTSNDKRASFSNYGQTLDIVAPGVSCLTIDRQGSSGYNSGDYKLFSGTSAACPVAAGVVGLMASINPKLSGDELRTVLLETTDKVGGYSYSSDSTHPDGTWNNEVGYGRINAYSAVNRSLQLFLYPDEINIESTTLKQPKYRANKSITAGGDFSVLNNESITFSAGKSIDFDPNFDVNRGASFDAVIE